MRDDRQRAEIELMDQLREVIDEAVHVVIAVRRPGAVAMPAQVGGDDMITALQLFGDPVPVAAMVAAAVDEQQWRGAAIRSEEHTSELQSLMRISYAVFCLKKKTNTKKKTYKVLTTERRQIS